MKIYVPFKHIRLIKPCLQPYNPWHLKSINVALNVFKIYHNYDILMIDNLKENYMYRALLFVSAVFARVSKVIQDCFGFDSLHSVIG